MSEDGFCFGPYSCCPNTQQWDATNEECGCINGFIVDPNNPDLCMCPLGSYAELMEQEDDYTGPEWFYCETWCEAPQEMNGNICECPGDTHLVYDQETEADICLECPTGSVWVTNY